MVVKVAQIPQSGFVSLVVFFKKTKNLTTGELGPASTRMANCLCFDISNMCSKQTLAYT